MTADLSHRTDILPRTRPPRTGLSHPGPGRPAHPGPTPRLRHRRVLVVGADDALAGPAGTSPAAALAAHLAARAGAVTLLTGVPRRAGGSPEPRYRYGLTFREEPVGPFAPTVTRLRHGVPRRGGPGGRAVGELSFASRAAHARLGERPDLVVALTPGPGGAAAGARIAQRHGVPLLVVVHDLLGGDAGPAAGWLARLERRALARATRVAVASETLRAAVRAYGVPADRVAVLPHAVPPGPVVDRITARRRLGQRPGAFLVAVPDPLSPGQDLPAVLRAARDLGPRTELVLLARAGEAEPLVEHVGGQPRVHVVPTLDETTRRLALAAADVLVVGEDDGRPPAWTPGGPRPRTTGVLLECFRAGRPVVAAVDVAGPSAREITLSRGAGLVVRRGDPAVLARAVGELRADDELRAAMGGAGRLLAHHRFDPGASLLAVDALVDALCLDG